MQYQIEVCKFLIINIKGGFLAITERYNLWILINKFMYVKSCYKISTLNNDELNSNINIYQISHLTFDMLCCFSKVWWYGARCTGNRLVPQNDLWFRSARPVRQNNDCVMCFYILWCKNVVHLKKMIINMMNLWF